MLDKKRDDIHMASETKSVSTILQEIGSFRILLPRFQRDYVWGKNNITSLVNSLIIGIPIPPIYLHRNSLKDKQFRIIDGQQRLFGLYLYYSDIFFQEEYIKKSDVTNYRLKDIPNLESDNYSEEIEKLMKKYNTENFDRLLGLELLNNDWLKGDFEKTKYRYNNSDITFSRLKLDDRLNFLNSTLQIVYITSDELFSKKVFEMINTTSVGLKEQQLRDCLYYDFFEEFYTNIDRIMFVPYNLRTYTIVEDAFEILIKYNLILDSKFFANANITYTTRKQSLLDLCVEYLHKPENLNRLEKIKRDLYNILDIDFYDINSEPVNKDIKIILVILKIIYKNNFTKTKIKKTISLYQLLEIPEEYREIGIYDSIEFIELLKYLKKHKNSSFNENFLRYFIQMWGETND